MIELVFRSVKETKGTFKFEEVPEGTLDEPKIGTLYVRKGTLKELDWQGEEQLLVVSLEARS